MKKILIYGINYYPEEIGTGLYTSEMAQYLSEYYNVEILTGFPYYPQWEIYDNYSEKEKNFSENINGIKINRYKQYVPEIPSSKERLKHLLDFSKGTKKILKKLPRDYDMIFSIAPTLFSAKNAVYYKKKINNNCKIWLHIQDFEVDAMFESGLSKIPVLKKIGYNWENNIYDNFDVISTISWGMMKNLENKNNKTEKYMLFNWAETEKVSVKEDKFREEYKLKNKFLIMYSGSVANKQDWEITLKTIEKCKDNKDIMFVIIGDGSKKKYLKEKKNELNLDNLLLLPVQPKERIDEIISSADIHFLAQKRNLKDSVMPSKILGITSNKKSLILLANSGSEVYRQAKENDFAFTLNENQYDDFYSKIIYIYNNKNEIKQKEINAYNYLKNNYDREIILKKLVLKIEETIKG